MGERKDQQKPRQRPRNKGRARPSVEERAKRVLLELRELAHDLAIPQGLTRREVAAALGELALPLSVDTAAAPNSPPARAAVEQLLASTRKRVDEAIKGSVAFRQGRVYCFQCDAASCRHARPQQRDETFAGYSPTGRPLWKTFTNFCLDSGFEQVDLLYGERPKIFALSQSADQLKEGMLAGFGRESLAFNLLGQVVTGLVPGDLNFDRDASAPRVALTLQIVETYTGKANRRLRANLLGMDYDTLLELAADGGERGPAERLRRLIRSTRGRLRELARKAAGAERRGQAFDLVEATRPLLSSLRGDFERAFRTGMRRTKHAQERHQEGARPTSDAMNDALGAADEHLYWDTQRGTIIVQGRRGRAHVFSEGGQLVTSLRLQAGELERKHERGRWQRLDLDRAARFRTALMASVPNSGVGR